MSNFPGPIFLSAADAGRLLNVTAATVRLMIRRGTLAVAAKTEGGIQLLARSEVERLVDLRQQKLSGPPRVAVGKA